MSDSHSHSHGSGHGHSHGQQKPLLQDDKHDEHHNEHHDEHHDDHHQTEDSEVRYRQLPWFTRTFGKMTPGGIRGSIFVLIATALGPGCLALPNAFKNSGVLLGSLLLIFSAILSIAALYIFFITSKDMKISSYAQSVTVKLGYKLGFLSHMVLIIYAFFVITAYQMMVSDLMNGFFFHLGVKGGVSEKGTFPTKIMNILTGIAALPLCIKRDLRSLNFVATLSVIGVFYVVIVLLIQTPSYADYYWSIYEIKYSEINWDFPSSFSYCVFAFTCYTVVFQIRGEMSKPTEKRIVKVIVRTVIVEFIIYFMLAFCAYMSLLGAIPAVVLNRPSLPGASQNDIPMQIGRIIMIFVIWFGLPLNISPIKQGIIMIHKGMLKQFILSEKEREIQKNNEKRLPGEHITSLTEPSEALLKISQEYNLILTCSIEGVSLLIVIFFPQVLIAIKFASGYLSCTLALLFPALLYGKMKQEQNNNKINLKVFLIYLTGISLAGIGYFAATIQVLQLCGVKFSGVQN